MITHVIIMAQGEQTRLAKLDRPKQLLPISDTETIIGRTLRMVSERVTGPKTVVCAGGGLWKTLPAWLCTQQVTRAEITHGLANTKGLWARDRTIVLLGDVVYSPHALDVICSARQLTFVGRTEPSNITGKKWGDVFGLVMLDRDHATVGDALRPELWQVTSGKLWDLLEALVHEKRGVHGGLFTDLGPDDYTDDIDTPEDVELVLPRLRAAVAK